MKLSGQRDVGDEAAQATQELRVLDAANRRADAFMRQCRAWRYWYSSRRRSRRSNATLSETMKNSASPPVAVWLAKFQCGIENTSCCDQSKECSPTVEWPVPDTTRQIMLQVVRFGRVA